MGGTYHGKQGFPHCTDVVHEEQGFRTLALESKKKALALLKGLIASSLAFAAAAGPVAMSLSVPDEGGLIHQALLTFSGQGISHMSGQGLCPSMGLPLHYGTSCIKPIGWAHHFLLLLYQCPSLAQSVWPKCAARLWETGLEGLHLANRSVAG